MFEWFAIEIGPQPVQRPFGRIKPGPKPGRCALPLLLKFFLHRLSLFSAELVVAGESLGVLVPFLSHWRGNRRRIVDGQPRQSLLVEVADLFAHERRQWSLSLAK